MEITRTVNDGVLDVAVDGRLDGYWSDHLERALTEAIGDGHHRIRLDCSKLSFLSSAGIAVLVKFHKKLSRINGALQVVNPSKIVSTALALTHLTALLVEPISPQVAEAAAKDQPIRHLERDGARFAIYDLDPRGSLTCRAVGNPAPLATGAFRDEDSFSLESMAPTFAIGVGAFGETAADCRSRFGELLSVAGATAYQPGDGTNVPDYLIATGAMASEVRMLYGLTCTGKFSHLIRFETVQRGATLGLARLLNACLAAAAAPSIGLVIVAEAAGLVGATLRRSPVEGFEGRDFYAHPGIRTRLAFTSEPAFVRGVALAAGVVTTQNAGGPNGHDAQLRPIGASCAGHVHAAAFRFRPIKKGAIEFVETVSSLFESEPLLGVLHLLHDDRGPAGAGESEFVRGACWIAPIAGDWPAA